MSHTQLSYIFNVVNLRYFSATLRLEECRNCTCFSQPSSYLWLRATSTSPPSYSPHCASLFPSNLVPHRWKAHVQHDIAVRRSVPRIYGSGLPLVTPCLNLLVDGLSTYINTSTMVTTEGQMSFSHDRLSLFRSTRRQGSWRSCVNPSMLNLLSPNPMHCSQPFGHLLHGLHLQEPS